MSTTYSLFRKINNLLDEKNVHCCCCCRRRKLLVDSGSHRRASTKFTHTQVVVDGRSRGGARGKKPDDRRIENGPETKNDTFARVM